MHCLSPFGFFFLLIIVNSEYTNKCLLQQCKHSFNFIFSLLSALTIKSITILPFDPKTYARIAKSLPNRKNCQDSSTLLSKTCDYIFCCY